MSAEQFATLGAFSLSLAVKDIRASRDFYLKLGFTPFGGDIDQNWLILKNGNCLIGLFQGMFDQNIITFNPRWDENAREIPAAQDIREIRQRLERLGLEIRDYAESGPAGPASFTVLDPDGNPILFDQHV
ncbi:MAG: VOC family protein [Candidatus Cloacimonetes bacterium]|jgi:catechol 2,3-dioxygenase-like lactoylglutathione lyase family enzyme|nr:VOC family protein [Candidatus Cloacimonadota bacterium]